ncbi:MAG: hypothetical protein HETSPECPRED_001345 [Heterodermia speciosa]|uniref:Uncharacterized protein n=1 Tax=Heterodermia speciosa TaxID=116794 RepID=A0A8H3EV17_9LECA|nr:MAG: hypothetical protein HETSPECPRED_001345 [Heterodermia speciosa]
MRYSLAYVAAAVGSASAAYLPGGYGNGGYGGGYGGSTGSIPTPSSYPSGTAPSYPSSSPSGYSSHSASYSASGHSSYSPSGYPSQSYPTSIYSHPTGISYYPTGTASYSHHPHESGSVVIPPDSSATYYPTDYPTGYPTGHPSGYPTGSHSHGTTGYSHHPHPTGSGSIPPYIPTTTQYVPTTIIVTHSTGTGTSTYTVTHTGTTTATKVITDYVPCSSAVGTASGTTYYSTYLTVSSHTATVTATTTEIEVICPTTSVPTYSPESTGSNSPSTNEHNNGGYGSESSTYGAIPTSSLYGHPSPDYPASTVYGPGSSPTAGTCAPSETTVYSTIVVTKTAIAEHPIGSACAECSTYTITLPNGYHTSVIVPPAGEPTHTPYQPGHEHHTSPYFPTSSATGRPYLPIPTGSVLPSGTASAYGYSYDYRL